MKEIIISKKDENQRIDKYILKVLDKATKSFLYKMFRKKNIKLNDSKINGNEILKSGDKICIYFSDDTFNKFSTGVSKVKKQKISFRIVYEDSNVIICNKPIGLLSQPDGKGSSLVDELEYYLYSNGEASNELSGFRVGICNRLDRNTSGIVIAGKNIISLQEINKAIASRNVDKIYHCIVKGVIDREGSIKGYLVKDSVSNKVSLVSRGEGKEIHTVYRPLDSNGEYTLLEVKLITGKSHQIRAHLASIGHPIIGDGKYGNYRVNQFFKINFGLKHQLLHAYKIRLYLSSSEFDGINEKEFVAAYSDVFGRIKKSLFKR
jgi:23S rRNA pseudouridine955/2504/2580 synthase